MQPSWTDPLRWAALLDGSLCPLCEPMAGNIIATLPSSFVSMDATVSVRGYCCLILRRHATELHALSAAEGAALMGDIQRTARAVQTCTGAIKINYEIHGNVQPHVHVHIIPRYPSDGIERNGKGFAALPPYSYEEGEFEALKSAMQRLLDGESK